MKPHLSLILWLTLILGSHAWAADDTVTMEPMQVDETPFGSLGISAVGRSSIWSRLTEGQDTKLKRLIIRTVKEGSVAHEKGLRAQDEVVKLDGRRVTELSVREVRQIWGCKEVGNLVRFEIIRGKTKTPKTVDLPVQKKKPKNPPPAEAATPTPTPPAATPAAPRL